MCCDLAALARRDRSHAFEQLAVTRRLESAAFVGRDLAEVRPRPVGEDGVDRQDVVHHRPVADRARAGGIVGGHPAQCGTARRRRIDREEQSLAREPRVQMVENDARLYADAPFLDVELLDVMQVLADVDHDCVVDGLAALRRAGAARQDRNSGFGANRAHGEDVVDVLGDDDAARLDLIDRRVGRVEPPRERIERNLAANLAAQPLLDVLNQTRAGVRLRSAACGFIK